MSAKAFNIGGVQYNAAMASAVDQDRVMSLLSGSVLERFAAVAQLGLEIDDSLLITMFMSMRADVKAQVVQMLMGKVFINGTQQSITVADFGGKMVQYNQLLAELLRWNLSDFFDWLPSAAKDVRQESHQSPAP